MSNSQDYHNSADPFKHSEDIIGDMSFDNLPLIQINENIETKSSNSQSVPRKPQRIIKILDERVLNDTTIVAYFDDPILPYALREIVNRK